VDTPLSFSSDHEKFVRKHKPDLWIHGHTHVSLDYMIKNTRVITNPKGYVNENPDFDPHYIIEV